MAVISLVTEDIVKVPLVSNSKTDVLRELVQILSEAGRIEDYDAVFSAVREREDKQSTGLEDAIAVPHGKTGAVAKLELAIGIAPQGIDFDSLDGKPSKLFFLLVAAPDSAGPHVAALAEIAKLSQSKSFCRALANAETAAEVVELLQGE